MAIPIRGGAVKPARPAAPPGLTRGMAKIATDSGGRQDIPDIMGVPNVAGYSRTIGAPGAAVGILPTPRVPGANSGASQRQRFLDYVKSSKGASRGRRGGRGTGYDQLLQSVQGGGKPQGPGVQGYISQLARTLLEGM